MKSLVLGVLVLIHALWIHECYSEKSAFKSHYASFSSNKNPGKIMEEHNLILYYKPNCPYCRKVIEYMDENAISIPMEDTSDREKEQELIEIGGKRQVPCLVIDGSALYESSDIIAWLSKNVSK